uniref:Uncharacterized protein n=1 Tax=uncultured bacterium W5-102b TaxID=1130996 RepID=H9BWJ9_9BACT|nr:hypothetical protein [uncultured bacterium W5-102b]
MSLHEQILRLSPDDLAAFRQRLRRRYSRDDIIDELKASAKRLGASPTMREFAADADAGIHPQTVVEHFGSWNRAKRAAGLMPRRKASRSELTEALAKVGRRLGRVPTVRDLDAEGPDVPGKGVYIREFGSWRTALAAAGFDAPSSEERLKRAIEHGAEFHLRTGRLPSFRAWDRLRGSRDDVSSAWQIYRSFDGCGGAWSAFQFAVSQRADRLRARVEAGSPRLAAA